MEAPQYRLPPRVRAIPGTEGFLFFGRTKFELLEPWTFEVHGFGSFTIPQGYQFDRASTPKIAWLLGFTRDGLAEVPALEHDFLCDLLSGGSEWLSNKLGTLPECPPPGVVHQHFETRLLEEGMRPSKARTMGFAVKSLGPKGWLKPSRWFNT
jgi:hypothetical protein